MVALGALVVQNLGAEDQTALLATLGKSAVEAAVGWRVGGDVVASMARELRASLSASGNVLSFALEGAAKLTEPVVGSDSTSSGENGESGSGETSF